MDATYIIGIQALIWSILLILLIYLFFKRLRVRKTETFEQRDN